jgi:hypothetical protein
MSKDHYFYVECRTDGGWIVPPNFQAEPWTYECDRPYGGFCWEHAGAGWLKLFGRVDSIFPMHPGPPDDRRGSPLLQHLDQFYDYASNDSRLCWIPYPELFIDHWQTDYVTVGSDFPAHVALLFGEGAALFPRDALLAKGLTPESLDDFRLGRRLADPLNVTGGRLRYELSRTRENEPVTVTWRETYAEFVGEFRAHLFQELRRYGRDEDLRILSTSG